MRKYESIEKLRWKLALKTQSNLVQCIHYLEALGYKSTAKEIEEFLQSVENQMIEDGTIAEEERKNNGNN